jgi:hypothetical protein
MSLLLILVLFLGGCSWFDGENSGGAAGPQVDIHCFGANPTTGDTSVRARCPDSVTE